MWLPGPLTHSEHWARLCPPLRKGPHNPATGSLRVSHFVWTSSHHSRAKRVQASYADRNGLFIRKLGSPSRGMDGGTGPGKGGATTPSIRVPMSQTQREAPSAPQGSLLRTSHPWHSSLTALPMVVSLASGFICSARGPARIFPSSLPETCPETL